MKKAIIIIFALTILVLVVNIIHTDLKNDFALPDKFLKNTEHLTDDIQGRIDSLRIQVDSLKRLNDSLSSVVNK